MNERIKDIASLFKMRLGFFVVVSAILGWFMAVDSMDIRSFLMLTIGGYLLTGASNGLNQIIEKRVDGLACGICGGADSTGREDKPGHSMVRPRGEASEENEFTR